MNSLPGVEVAGGNVALPLSGVDRIGDVRMSVEGRPRLSLDQAPKINHGAITLHYFRAMGIPLLAGRAFTGADTRDTPKVAIIDERLAREYWPDESPLGKRIHLGAPKAGTPGHTIVGVVGAIQHERIGATMHKNVYTPLLQKPVGLLTLAVHSKRAASLVADIRSVVKEMDPNLPIAHVSMMSEIVADSIWQPRLYGILFAVFAVVALFLALVGIYGVTSYAVTAQTKEIGVRMALGARPRDVLKLIIGRGMIWAAGGVLVGLLGAWLLTRLMKTLLFNVSETDPLTFAGVALLLSLVALLACYIPARRATKLDPLVTLRFE